MVTKKKPEGYFIQYGKRVNGRIKSNEQISLGYFEEIIEDNTYRYLRQLTLKKKLQLLFGGEKTYEYMAKALAFELRDFMEYLIEVDIMLNHNAKKRKQRK